ncbi:MAG: divergent PAP2 family protein [Acutalibacteraceae bacterium]|jgi:acid phosphatase family membrane protein YuiD|nr:divergent PAP2 family protein [Lachnospiraceae bacterium]MEE3405207.1 divergent PAP2 family protein [Acutalibacteraceae bacterium]
MEALLQNRILIAAGIAWAVSQISKTILHTIINGKLDWSRLKGDGGMPSSHSASVTALAVATGMVCGIDSPFFAIAVVFAAITCHDAMNSRREIGKHSVVLNELIKKIEQEEPFEVVLKEFVGHTPLQVLIGILVGGIIAFLVCR